MKIYVFLCCVSLLVILGCEDSISPSEPLPTTPEGFAYDGQEGTEYIQNLTRTDRDTLGKDSVVERHVFIIKVINRNMLLPSGKSVLECEVNDSMYYPSIKVRKYPRYLFTDAQSLFASFDKFDTVGSRVLQLPFTVGHQFKVRDTESTMRRVTAVGATQSFPTGKYDIITTEGSDTLGGSNPLIHIDFRGNFAAKLMTVSSQSVVVTEYRTGKKSTSTYSYELIAIKKP